MSTDRRVIVVPFLGDDVDEVRVGEWCVAPGTPITIDQLLARLEAADATYEIISPYTGRVRELHAKVGDTLLVGAWLVTVAAEADADEDFIYNLPDLGEGVRDAKLTHWKVKVGDRVRAGDSLAELETDKAVVEVPSPVDGIIQTLHAQRGAKVQVGAPLVTIAPT
jgi:pyruvate dehydrogenase E2 component (dihydrolipoamide acetyltransferase)